MIGKNFGIKTSTTGFYKIILVVSLVFFLTGLSLLASEKESGVLDFVPQGLSKNLKQVKIRFRTAMVPFGDPNPKTDYFKIDCPLLMQPRWIDTKLLVYDFKESLESGKKCNFILNPDAKDAKGQPLTGKKEFSFHTGGPSLAYSIPYQGSTIEEEQHFILETDGSVDLKSLSGKIHFETPGLPEKIKAIILEGSEKEKLLKAQKGDSYSADRVVVVKSELRFSAESSVSLVWNAGIQSPNGLKTEKPQVYHYFVRPPFQVTYHCQKENADSGCIPFTPISISFTSDTFWKYALKIKLRSSKKVYPFSTNPGKEGDPVSDLQFPGPFEPGERLYLELPPGMEDDSGRKLGEASAKGLEIPIGDEPVLAKFSARFGILESQAEPVLPVSVRNLEGNLKLRIKEKFLKGDDTGTLLSGKKFKVSPSEIGKWLETVENASRDTSVFQVEEDVSKFQLPKPNGPAPLEVMGIPLGGPGFYVVELESPKLGNALIPEKTPMFVATSALVTNLAVHLKWGEEYSVVWVTSLDKGEPVAGASVKIFNCKGELVSESLSDSSGLARPGSIPYGSKIPNCGYGTYRSGLLVTAEKGGDLSFVHSSWNRGIEPWRFNIGYYFGKKNLLAHTIHDRPLYKIGETVHMKTLLRSTSLAGFRIPGSVQMPAMMVIEHQGSQNKFTIPLKWESGGFTLSKWKIPGNAKLGEYKIRIGSSEKDYNALESGTFRIEEFRIPLLKGSLSGPVKPIINSSPLSLDIHVEYLGGGPAGKLPLKIRSIMENTQMPEIKGFEDYRFSAGKVKEGITSYSSEYEAEDQENSISRKVLTQDASLDSFGNARVNLTGIPKRNTSSSLITEVEYKDPNGEIQSMSKKFIILPGKEFIGIRETSWASKGKTSLFRIAMVNADGKAVPSASIKVKLFSRKSYSHRKRMVGGFYSYESYDEIKKISDVCSLKTETTGTADCKVELGEEEFGEFVLEATAKDSSGKDIFTKYSFYKYGAGETWFSQQDSDRMDIIPEKKIYEVGEKARFQIRTPFRESWSLITLEREGVMEAFVRKISGKNPVYELPVLKQYSPNIYMSILSVRGRVNDPKPTAFVDLGKPSFRLGISSVKIGWKPYELKVALSMDKNSYKTREKGKLKISVKNGLGKSPIGKTLVSLAAVDEGLLQMMGNKSWEVLQAMMGERGNSVNTYTSQMQVVGRRHYGLKAIPPGGGGGAPPSREMFDSLLLWKGNLELDEKGEGEAVIPFNDSVTAFRIVAIAHSGNDLFGTGFTKAITHQDLVSYSGLSPVAREGDELFAEFTIKNSSDKKMSVTAKMDIPGLKTTFAPKTIGLDSGQSDVVSWPVKIPEKVSKLQYSLTLTSDSGERDAMKIVQKISSPLEASVIQGILERISGNYKISIEESIDSLPDKGSVVVGLKDSIAGNMEGVREYMNSYPYSCLEQQVSKAISLSDSSRWDKTMQNIESYFDSDGLLKFFPSSWVGSDILTSYVIKIADEAGWKIPESSLKKMINGLSRFADGSIYRNAPIQTTDLTLRRISALNALSRHGFAKPDVIGGILPDLDLLPTSALLDWWGILLKVKQMPDRENQLLSTENIIKSRLNTLGSRIEFTRSANDGFYWLFSTPQTNNTKLLLQLLSSGKMQEDIPKIVNGIMHGLKNGKWDTTFNNAFGVLAIEKFSRKFEKDKITGNTSIAYGKKTETLKWDEYPKGKKTEIASLKGKHELSVDHTGTGKPWMNLLVKSATPLKKGLASGIFLTKTIIPLEQKIKGKYSKGDILSVRLEVSLDQASAWVVVTDPIPAGASILGKGIGPDSSLGSDTESRSNSGWPAFTEKGMEFYRNYYEFLPQGKIWMDYRIRLNSSGLFQIPNSRAEAMYTPEVFGEIPNEKFKVE